MEAGKPVFVPAGSDALSLIGGAPSGRGGHVNDWMTDIKAYFGAPTGK